MSEAIKLEVELVKAEDKCLAGQEVGDTFTIPGDTDNFSCDGICIHALYSMMAKLVAMRYGANFPLVPEYAEEVTHTWPDA